MGRNQISHDSNATPESAAVKPCFTQNPSGYLQDSDLLVKVDPVWCPRSETKLNLLSLFCSEANPEAAAAAAAAAALPSPQTQFPP